MIKKAVILCGGLATRFLPISKCVPKEMFPVLNKSTLQIIIEDLHKAGIEQVLIVSNNSKDAITKLFDRNVELEDRIKKKGKEYLLNDDYYVNNLTDVYFKQQNDVMGTGYGVELAKNWVGDEPFVMAYGDELLFNDGKNVFQQLIDAYKRNKKTVIAVQECDKKDVHKYGIIDFTNKNGNDYTVTRIVEKPSVEDAPSNISYIGPSVITNEIFDEIKQVKPDKNGEIVLTNAFDLLARKNKLMAVDVVGQRADLGNKLGFVKANIIAGLKDKEISEELYNFIKDLINK